MITDGEQSKKDDSKLSVDQILAQAAQPLKDKGVRVIALGIGKKVNMENLETIASDKRLVFKASSFHSLLRIVTSLKKGTCLGKKKKCSLSSRERKALLFLLRYRLSSLITFLHVREWLRLLLESQERAQRTRLQYPPPVTSKINV